MDRDGPDFGEPRLAEHVEALGEEQIDALPFGAVRLDADGKVVHFSKAERDLSGFGERPTLGRHFFSQIAPCMDSDHFRGRIDRALAAGTLDLEFAHFGDFEDRDRELTVRVQSSSDGGCWIFMQREG